MPLTEAYRLDWSFSRSAADVFRRAVRDFGDVVEVRFPYAHPSLTALLPGEVACLERTACWLNGQLFCMTGRQAEVFSVVSVPLACG